MKSAKDVSSRNKSDLKLLDISNEQFSHGGMIPAQFTCDGTNKNPSLSVDHIPDDAVSLAVIVEDPDAPGGVFCHWVIWNLPITNRINEKETRGTTGTNDFGHVRYSGPCPPSGTHRYQFNVYALDSTLSLPPGAGKHALEQAMSGHILASGLLEGKYQRHHG